MSEAISSFLYQASGGLVSHKTVSFATQSKNRRSQHLWGSKPCTYRADCAGRGNCRSWLGFSPFPKVCLQKNVIPRRGFGIFPAPIASQLIRLTLTVFVEKILQSSAKSTLLVGNNQAVIYHSIARARLTDKPKKVDQDRYPASSAALSPP
jgi:hypothetical protein